MENDRIISIKKGNDIAHFGRESLSLLYAFVQRPLGTKPNCVVTTRRLSTTTSRCLIKKAIRLTALKNHGVGSIDHLDGRANLCGNNRRFITLLFQIFTKPLNICSDFHLGRHFCRSCRGCIRRECRNFVTRNNSRRRLQHDVNAPNEIFPRKRRIYKIKRNEHEQENHHHVTQVVSMMCPSRSPGRDGSY